jgi:hypothetical protein
LVTSRNFTTQPGGECGGELDRTHPAQRPARHAEPVEQLEVLQQCRLRVHGERPDLAATRGDRDPALLVRERRRVEQLRDALPALDLDEQGAPAVRSERQRQRGGHRGLARAALAGHDVQASLRQRRLPSG